MPHPSTSSAYGIWSLNEVRDAVRGDNWPIASDPEFANVALLLNADGLASGSTAIVDASSNSHTVTLIGNTQVDTAVFKYGTGSVQFDGSGDGLTVPADASHQFGTGDLTVEFWVYMNSVSSDYTFVGRGESGGTFDFFIQYRPSISNNLKVNTGPSYSPYDFSWTPSSNTWYHVAVTRSGTDLKAFIDGSQIGTTQTDSNDISRNVTLGVGYNSQANLQYLNGYMDDVRVTKGVARYTANFTPPTEAFPTQ